MPLLYGTIVFAGLCVLALLISWILARMGKNDYAKYVFQALLRFACARMLLKCSEWGASLGLEIL